MFVGAMTLAALGVACSGSPNKYGVGTVLPVTPPPSATPAICTPVSPLTIPPAFPAEVALPAGLTVFSVTTTPHLHIVTRVPPPDAAEERTFGNVAFDLVTQLTGKGWRSQLNARVNGADYDLSAPDGRNLHINTIAVPACHQVELTLDALWITG